MNAYMSGTLVRTTATFTNIAGAAADPTTITLKYQTGAGAVTTAVYPAAPVVKDSTGVYHADLDTTGWAGAGPVTQVAEWIGTGAVQAIAADSWQVIPPAL